MHCVGRARFLAELAAYAAYLAILADCLAIVFGVAKHVLLAIIWNKRDKVFRARLDAHAASCALIFINCGYSIKKADGAEFACRDAASAAQAPVNATFRAASGKLHGCLAVIESYIAVPEVAFAFAASAAHQGSPAHKRLYWNAHYLSNGSRASGAADWTGGRLCLRLCNGLSQGIAARVAATSAVGAGKRFPYKRNERIRFNFKFYRGYSQADAKQEAHAA
jgi:hypothetical protein